MGGFCSGVQTWAFNVAGRFLQGIRKSLQTAKVGWRVSHDIITDGASRRCEPNPLWGFTHKHTQVWPHQQHIPGFTLLLHQKCCSSHINTLQSLPTTTPSSGPDWPFVQEVKSQVPVSSTLLLWFENIIIFLVGPIFTGTVSHHKNFKCSFQHIFFHLLREEKLSKYAY